MFYTQTEGDTGGTLHPQLASRGSNTSLTLKYSEGKSLRQMVIIVVALVAMMSLSFVNVSAQDAEVAAPVVVDAYGEEVTIADASRVITVDGSITEIVFALGASEQVIARDDSSLYPPSALALESVGYVRRLSAEPVLALDPTLIITTESVGPVEAVDQLKASGVTFLVLPAATTIEGIIANVETIAAALGYEAEAVALIEKIQADYDAAVALQAQVETKPRVMFIYARGAGAVSVAGTNTSADAMIALAGAENAVTEFEGYLPITAEAVVTAAPDIFLLMSAGLSSVGGVDGLLELPGIAETPAGQNRRVVAVEDLYLLGFSTRTGTAALDLTYLLHDELPTPLLSVLRADGRFNTLQRALGIAGQEALLTGEDSYTLFAPTDEVFAEAFPPEVIEGFLASVISVQATLAYHILPGVVTVDDVAAAETLQPLFDGSTIAVSAGETGPALNGSVHVTETLEASNGLIHVVDGVLLPSR